MGWKDLMKNVTDKATSVAETAQAKFEEQKQLSAIKKEEQKSFAESLLLFSRSYVCYKKYVAKLVAN